MPSADAARLIVQASPIADPRETLSAFLDQERAELTSSISDLFDETVSSISTDELALAIEMGEISPLVLKTLELNRSQWAGETLAPVLVDALIEGDEAANEEAEAQGLLIVPPSAIEIVQQLTPSSVGVRQYLDGRLGELLSGMTSSENQAVRSLIDVARRGSDRYSIGGLARDLKPTIVLRADVAARLQNEYIAARDSGVPAKKARADLIAKIDAARLARAEMILEHELSNAWNEGGLLGIEERVLKGEIDPAVVKIWLTEGDSIVCPVCAPLHLQAVGLAEDFSNVSGAEAVLDGTGPGLGRGGLKFTPADTAIRTAVLDKPSLEFEGRRPPAHVRCRCGLGYKRPGERRRLVRIRRPG